MFKLFFNNRNYESPITAEKLQQILDSIITQHLAPYGFTHHSAYGWRNDKAPFRKCVGYTKLKGESGTLTWGINLDFIPVVRKKIEWFRTEKRFLMHLSDHPIEYKESFIGKDNTKGIGSHWGENEAIKTINSLWDRNETKILTWFEQASSVEGLIELAYEQVKHPKLYILHYPKASYILPFLYARLGKLQNALNLFDMLESIHFNDNEEIRCRVREILLEIAD